MLFTQKAPHFTQNPELKSVETNGMNWDFYITRPKHTMISICSDNTRLQQEINKHIYTAVW